MPIHSTDISLSLQGASSEIAVITLNRPAKRNALNDGLILAIRDMFQAMPHGVRAAVIHGSGDHFCAGLDLSELSERDAGQGLHHSRMWHSALECVQYGPVPVVAALHGAVVGGGLELLSAEFPQKQQELFEGLIGLVAVASADAVVAYVEAQGLTVDWLLEKGATNVLVEIGNEVDLDLEFGHRVREDEAGEVVAVGVLLKIDEVILWRDLQRMGENLGAGMGGRLQPDDLRSELDRVVILVVGEMIDACLDRHSLPLRCSPCRFFRLASIL